MSYEDDDVVIEKATLSEEAKIGEEKEGNKKWGHHQARPGWRMLRVQVTSCNAHSTQICPPIQIIIIRRSEIEGPRCRNR